MLGYVTSGEDSLGEFRTGQCMLIMLEQVRLV